MKIVLLFCWVSWPLLWNIQGYTTVSSANQCSQQLWYTNYINISTSRQRVHDPTSRKRCSLSKMVKTLYSHPITCQAYQCSSTLQKHHSGATKRSTNMFACSYSSSDWKYLVSHCVISSRHESNYALLHFSMFLWRSEVSMRSTLAERRVKFKRTGWCVVSWSTWTKARPTLGRTSSLSWSNWLTSCAFHSGVSAGITTSTSTKYSGPLYTSKE